MVGNIKSFYKNVEKRNMFVLNVGLIEIPTGKYAAICDSYGWRKRRGCGFVIIVTRIIAIV